MKNISKWFKKSMRWSMALLLIAVLGVGLTIAYLTDIEAAVNKLTVGRISVEATEDCEDLTKTDIGVTANGSSKCYVRMRVDVPNLTYPMEGQEETGEARLTLADGTVITATEWQSYTKTIPAKISDPTVVVTTEWTKFGDFWYLSIPLNQDDTAYLLSEITYPGLWDEEANQMVTPLPDGITEDMLAISITVEAVQADGIDVGGAVSAQAAFNAFQQVDPGSTQV